MEIVAQLTLVVQASATNVGQTGVTEIGSVQLLNLILTVQRHFLGDYGHSSCGHVDGYVHFPWFSYSHFRGLFLIQEYVCVCGCFYYMVCMICL